MPNQELKDTYGLPPADILKRMIEESPYVNGVRLCPEPNEPGEKRFLVVLAVAFGPEDGPLTAVEAVHKFVNSAMWCDVPEATRLMLWDAKRGIVENVSDEEMIADAMEDNPPCLDT